MKMLQRLLLAVVLLGLVSCGLCKAGGSRELEEVSKDTVRVSVLGHLEGDKILIEHDVDIKGAVCIIPKGKTLVFKKGTIRNGTLIGNNTQIECNKSAFDKVTIRGIWNVPEINTRLFRNLSYENALKDVVALSNPKVKNTIVIESGDYIVKASKGAVTCISICDNTDLIINGTIRLLPNDLKNYNILEANGNNINIKGKGIIVGDKHTHTGTEGEWGMGINLKGAVNVTVSGLTIKDCWGDCIYIGDGSQNVFIDRCLLDNSRRQGISITNAEGVTIKDCRISNVSGTDPQSAIDIEPNTNNTVNHIIIDNVEANNCEAGFIATIGQKNVNTKKIGEVAIKNCTVSVLSKAVIRMSNCESLVVECCTLEVHKGKKAVRALNVRNVVVKNNTIRVKNEGHTSLESVKRVVAGEKKYNPIEVSEAKMKLVEKNIIIDL